MIDTFDGRKWPRTPITSFHGSIIHTSVIFSVYLKSFSHTFNAPERVPMGQASTLHKFAKVRGGGIGALSCNLAFNHERIPMSHLQ